MTKRMLNQKQRTAWKVYGFYLMYVATRTMNNDLTIHPDCISKQWINRISQKCVYIYI